MFRIEAIALALIGGLTTVAAQADVWRWTDPQGHVQYSDRWVPGSVLIKSTSPHNAANPGAPEQADAQKPATSNTEYAEQQAQKEAENTVKQDMAASKTEQCKQATETYQKAIQSRRIYKEGKNGEREYLSDKEADAYRAQALLERKAACGK